MFQSLFKSRKTRNRNVIESLYRQIVAASRQPIFYSRWSVPDTPLGRFEMISVHMFLFLHRLKDSDGALRSVAQDTTDMFFTDIDHSLRELGIGDVGVPKRMKKLAQMFYGRADAYGRAVEAEDTEALEAALCRNVKPEEDNWPSVTNLSAYIMLADRIMTSIDQDALLAGEVRFPQADQRGQTEHGQ